MEPDNLKFPPRPKFPKLVLFVSTTGALIIGLIAGFILGVEQGKKITTKQTLPNNYEKQIPTIPLATPTPITTVNNTSSPMDVKSNLCNVSFSLEPNWTFQDISPFDSLYSSYAYIKYNSQNPEQDDYIKIACSPVPFQYFTSANNYDQRVMNFGSVRPKNKETQTLWGQSVVSANFSGGEPQILPADRYYFPVTGKQMYEIILHTNPQDANTSAAANTMLRSIKFLD